MALLVVSSTLIAATCIGMAYIILNVGRCERRDHEQHVLIARLAGLSPQDERDLLKHLIAGH